MISREEMGRTIRQARLSKGYTQEKLAEMLGYEPGGSSSIRKYESGKYYPPYEKLRDISVILGIPLDKLVP